MRRKRMPQRVTAGCLAETCLAHGPAILSQIAFGYFRSGRAVASSLSRLLLRLVESCLARQCSFTVRWTRILSSLLSWPESSLLLLIGGAASVAHLPSTSFARQQRAATPRSISSRPALRTSLRISAGVSLSTPATKTPMSPSCHTPKSPNQPLERTAARRVFTHFR